MLDFPGVLFDDGQSELLAGGIFDVNPSKHHLLAVLEDVNLVADVPAQCL